MSSLTERKARLIVHGDQPYNAELLLDLLRASLKAPAENFYVRLHRDQLSLDAVTWRLIINDGTGASPDMLLSDLRARFQETR